MSTGGLVLSSRGVVCGVELLGRQFAVEYDPSLPDRGITEYNPRLVIRLREWNSEVFLHECIHVAFAVCPKGAWWGPDFLGNRRLTDAEQEAFVQHLSHFLNDVGFRLPPKRGSTS